MVAWSRVLMQNNLEEAVCNGSDMEGEVCDGGGTGEGVCDGGGMENGKQRKGGRKGAWAGFQPICTVPGMVTHNSAHIAHMIAEHYDFT